MDMLDKDHSGVLTWTPEGDVFQIQNSEAFETKLFRKYFNTSSNIDSFQRRLKRCKSCYCYCSLVSSLYHRHFGVHSLLQILINVELTIIDTVFCFLCIGRFMRIERGVFFHKLFQKGRRDLLFK